MRKEFFNQVARAEAWLIEANSEATACMKLEERRKKEQMEAFDKVKKAEREQDKADEDLKNADANLLSVLESVGKEVIIRGEDDSVSVTSSNQHHDDIHSRASVVSHEDYGTSVATSADHTPTPSHHGDHEDHWMAGNAVGAHEPGDTGNHEVPEVVGFRSAQRIQEWEGERVGIEDIEDIQEVEA